MNRPLRPEWSLENGVVHGFRASGWVYSCARIQSQHVGSLPWRVWEPSSSGDMKVIPGHDLEYVIEQPNNHQTRRFQMEHRALNLLLGGNALSKVVSVGRTGKERPDEIWLLNADRTKPVPEPESWLSGYEIRDHSGILLETLDPAVVSHAQFPDPTNPYWGTPPLRAISKVVDMDVAQVTWNRELVDNDAAPAGVFYDPNIHQERDRQLVKATIRKHFTGPLKAREPMVLSGGAKWIQLGISPRELDWIESRKFTVGEICTAMGLLTSRFLMDAATYNNLTTAVRYEWENGALPIAEMIGDALSLTLLSREDRRRGRRILPDTSGVPVLRDHVHKAAESYERLVRSMVPPQTAAAIVDLPVGELLGGDRSWRPAMFEEVVDDPELTEEDL